MRIVELVIDEEALYSGIEAISIVDRPAIEENFIALSKEHKIELAEVDKEKRILMGAALVPNKNIYRQNEDEEYYIYFSKDTVRKASELFLMRGNQNKSTLEHEAELHGLSVVESWIIEDETHDKSRKYDMELPIGTWMVSMKVNNDEVWNDYVKTGKVKGFSIEGYFTDKVAMSSEFVTEEEATEILEEIFDHLRDNTLKLKSYADYPDAVANNAKRALEWAEKNGWGSCGTAVGKRRASQLASKSAITVSTIKRMRSFLARHAGDLEASTSYSDGCGKLMYDAWGGKAGLRWAESKLKELGQIEAAKVGSRGGITKSPKAPASDTPNKNPKGKGTAKGTAKGKTGAKVSAKDRAALKKKADDFNDRYRDKLGYGITTGMLASVFQRGLGAFNTSHSPKVRSASQWAHARVNAFMYLVRNGRPQNAKYTTDYDLLPKKHPKAKK
jgi:hypothetical protein